MRNGLCHEEIRKMLLKFDRMEDVDFPKLMEIYRESNTDNISYFFPGCRDEEAGRKQVEEGFYAYLNDDFFSKPGNRYYVLSEGDVWLSAIRLFPVPGRDNAFYAEALETRPDRRKEGHAAELFRQLFRELSENGSFEVTDSVSKKNIASLRTHEACGFQIFQENSVCVLNGYENLDAYGMRYNYEAGSV